MSKGTHIREGNDLFSVKFYLDLPAYVCPAVHTTKDFNKIQIKTIFLL